MAQYNRQSTFLPDEVLTAEQLEDEFNAIQAAINDIDSRVGSVEGGLIIVYNAADPAFSPLGGESFAARVANAIQAARAADAKTRVVWVPKFMWGYSADHDFNLAMFDPAVLVVREGSLKPWYDPVAYGVDLTGTRKADDIIQLCIDHAAQATGPGSRVVAFTVPGDYMLDSNVTHNSGVGIIVLPGVNFTGDSEFVGSPAWKYPPDPETVLYAQVRRTTHQSFDGNQPVGMVQWQQVDLDPQGMVDLNADATKLTVPEGFSGIAKIGGVLNISADSVSPEANIQVFVVKNGGSIALSEFTTMDGDDDHAVAIDVLTAFEEGDQFWVTVVSDRQRHVRAGSRMFFHQIA